MAVSESHTRENEWWVPNFGPSRFRLLVGLSFYPYTLMNASYVAIGSLLAPSVSLSRLALLFLAYVLAVGLGAHSLDALAPNKPWGKFLSRGQLLFICLAGLIPALAIGLYAAVAFAPWLLPLGVLELFFLLAYNLEWSGGRFHTDFWFAFSWGFLPVLAGYVLQTGGLGIAGLAGGAFGFFSSTVEISASRPYKEMKRDGSPSSRAMASRLEMILKAVVGSVIAVAAFLLAYRMA